MRRDLADKVGSLTESGWPPKLVSIAVGDAEPAMLYIRNQRRVAELLEIAF
jgi:methylenetetrahydrofolate dehydrogenase (NADP+)/methenyltetrahydrofolate cyclohydrolase